MDQTARTETAMLVSIENCRQSYPKEASSDVIILDDVQLSLREGEIVGLLGRSGSGKSTLLRIVSGLLRPTAGDVRWRGQPITGPVKGVSMVFQSFALFPWLTVEENVALGLEAQGVPRSERETRAEEAIDLIGLGGYENAYPKEMSGGMRQRVGLARALVVHPDLLLMDEPFSALDVLTAETLRTDLIDLWSEGRLPVKSILMVTHNIEEAVLMCDRILVFSSNPGRVASELTVPFAHPRERLAPDFRQMVDDIYALMTRRPVEHPKPQTVGRGAAGAAGGVPHPRGGGGRGPPPPPVQPLPVVGTNLMAGLMETIEGEPYNGRADLPALANAFQMEADELLPIGEALQMLGFAEFDDGDIKLKDAGKRFVEADTDDRKEEFASALRAHVPIMTQIRQVLDERWNHRAPALRFRDELEDHMSADYADATMRTVIAWGRYAELFSYDREADQFSLDDDHDEDD